MELQTLPINVTPNVYTQLLQCEFDVIEKDSVNPMFKKGNKPNYASLPAIFKGIQPTLRKHGLIDTAYVSEEKPDVLVVQVTHPESMTYISTSIQLINMSDMQKSASARTYARKALAELVGAPICEESDDDDGNTVSTYNSVKSAFSKAQPVNVTPEPKSIAKPEQTLSANERMALTLELHELWKVKEGSVRAEETDMSKRAELLFKNDLVGVNDSALIKLKDYLLKMQSVIIHKPIA